ncbi:hypothetical protein ACFWJ4_15375 [Kitasatospora sp. NPDC127067]|uniref:hypothetical protein n=1 Tax=Kitasatospora sp. NPDC127067 TaxID=3347126 RepID=UPI0036475902
MIKMRTFAAAAVAAASLTLGVAATPASAAPAPNGPTAVSVQSVDSPDTTSAPAVERTRIDDRACLFTFPDTGAPSTWALCDTKVRAWQWTDGRYEYALVGTDRRVWHTYQTTANGSWASWTPLGDSSDVQDGVWLEISSGLPVVQVLGSNGSFWCNSINSSGAWTNWYIC